MYNSFGEEKYQDLVDFFYYKDIIDRENYPNPLFKYKGGLLSEIMVIGVTDKQFSTTCVVDMSEFFVWKTLKNRRLKLEKIMKNV